MVKCLVGCGGDEMVSTHIVRLVMPETDSHLSYGLFVVMYVLPRSGYRISTLKVMAQLKYVENDGCK